MKKVIKMFWFLVFYVLAVTLIEHQSGEWLLEVASNVFGSLALMVLGTIIFDEE